MNTTNQASAALGLNYWVISALIGVLTVCFWGDTRWVQAQDWADKMFPVKFHDFGTARQFQDLEFRFPVQNQYVEDVEIKRVSSSCLCTTVFPTKTTLKTGETGYIVARVNSSRFLGEKGAKITVEIAKPFPAVVELFDKVKIVPEGTAIVPPRNRPFQGY